MFEYVFESFREAAHTTLQTQQEMFKNWVALWPGIAGVPVWGDQVRQFQNKWAESVTDLLKRQHRVIETQFKAGLQSIEKAFHLGEAKTVEEIRGQTVELWQKCFEALKQAYEAELREFQVVLEKWTELMTKVA
jgi:hypothetical protein